MLATLSRATGRVLTARGAVDPRWFARLGKSREVSFVDQDQVIAVVASPRHFTAAGAALPLADVQARSQAALRQLLPVTVGAGLLLTAALYYLGRMQRALPSVLRQALKRSEFFVLYQPIVDLRSGRWIGAEALARWRRGGGEMVRPDLFIPEAEDSGLIQRITRRVVELVARDAAGALQRHPDFQIGINLSSVDVHDEAGVALLGALARDTGAGQDNLLVEVTERGFVKPELAGKVVAGPRALGFRIAIDDFGSGHSSLSHLGAFPLDALNVDKSFVDTIGKDAATSQGTHHRDEQIAAPGPDRRGRRDRGPGALLARARRRVRAGLAVRPADELRRAVGAPVGRGTGAHRCAQIGLSGCEKVRHGPCELSSGRRSARGWPALKAQAPWLLDVLAVEPQRPTLTIRTRRRSCTPGGARDAGWLSATLGP